MSTDALSARPSGAPSSAPSGAFRLFRVGAAVSTLVGVALAAAVIVGLDAVLELLLALAFWPGATPTPTPGTLLNAGIAGGVLAGWGLTLLGLASRLGEDGLRPLAPMLIQAVIVWFVLDGAASWAAGAPFNIVMNLPYLLLLAGPLLALRSARS